MERYFGPITDRNMHHGAESTGCGQIDVAKRATDLKSKWRRKNGRGTHERGGALQFAMRLLASFEAPAQQHRPALAPSLQLIYVWGLALVCRHLVGLFAASSALH